MKTKTRKVARTGKDTAVLSAPHGERMTHAVKHDVIKSHETKAVCRHCGGMLRREPDGAVCVMCGRGESHKCDMCMHMERNAA